MKVISINVSLPKDLRSGQRVIPTGIFKEPISGIVAVRTLNLDGDRQADLKVHGGPDKAVYAYPSEHYAFWRQQLGNDLHGWGTFGENLTIEGILEDAVSIGDHLGIGDTVFQITQPRLPCFKLAAKLDRDDIIERMLDSRRTGFYLRVLREGSVRAGEGIQILQRDPHRVTIREITDLYCSRKPQPSRLERALSVPGLSNAWREHFQKILSGGT